MPEPMSNIVLDGRVNVLGMGIHATSMDRAVAANLVITISAQAGGTVIFPAKAAQALRVCGVLSFVSDTDRTHATGQGMGGS